MFFCLFSVFANIQQSRSALSGYKGKLNKGHRYREVYLYSIYERPNFQMGQAEFISS